MKRLLLFLALLVLPVIGFGQDVINLNRVNATKLNGQLSTFYVDTSSTAQTKSGHLILSDSLYITKLATSATKVLSPTSTGGTTVLESSDASEITFDTLSFDFGDVTNDLDVGDTLEFDNGAKIHNEETDTLFLEETVIKLDGDVYITGTIVTERAGGMTYISTSGIQTIGTGGTFERLNEGNIAYTDAHLYGFTHDDGRLTYTGTPTIHVTIVATLAIQSGETAQVCNFRIAKDGTTIAATNMPITFVSTTTQRGVVLTWMDEVATDSYYELFGTSDTNADTFDVLNAVFRVIKH